MKVLELLGGELVRKLPMVSIVLRHHPQIRDDPMHLSGSICFQLGWTRPVKMETGRFTVCTLGPAITRG